MDSSKLDVDTGDQSVSGSKGADSTSSVQSAKPDEYRLKPLLKIRDVVAYTGTSDSTIRRAVRRGELEASRMPGGWRFRLHNVDAWVDSFTVEPEPKPSSRARLSDVLAGVGSC